MSARTLRLVGWLIAFSVLSGAGAPPPATDPAPVAGQLLDAAGKPLAGVYVCLSARHLDVYDAKLPSQPLDGDHLSWSRSDANGRFSFPAQRGTYALLAHADDGQVIVKSRDVKTPDAIELKLVPWSRLEGRVMFGDKPAPAGVAVRAYNLDDAFQDRIGPYLHFSTKTDASGHFVFPRVVPGKYRLQRTVVFNRQLVSGTLLTVTVAPGASTEVALVSMGRSVIGRIPLPDGFDEKGWYIEGAELARHTPLPAVALPPDVLQMTQADRGRWFESWRQTADGKRTVAERERSREEGRKVALIDAGGSFRIEDVAAGTYDMPVEFFARKDGRIVYDKVLIRSSFRFTVPPMPDGFDPSPLDVGSLAAQSAGVAHAGETAPDFVMPMLDDEQRTLWQFRGKVVLLDFWGTWCGVCVADLPALKKIHEKFAARPEFVMVSLSVRDELAKLRTFVQEKGMTWPQAILGDPASAWAVTFYPVRGYPSYWLIGADGRVVAHSWRLADVEGRIEEALRAAQK